jgi:hypothetical protein
MAGEWECDVCGYTNDASDKWCIQCYQDREDVEIIKPADRFPFPFPTPMLDENVEDDEDENVEDEEDENDEDY